MSDIGDQRGICYQERPPAPQAWNHTVYGTPPVQFLWHHIIPYSALRNCWNALATHHEQNRKAAIALQIFMRMLGFDQPRVKGLLAIMAAGRVGVIEQQEIETAVAYPPWDIVEGPKNRADDPDDDFDEFTAGLSPAERNRMGKLQSLFEGLKIFNQAASGVGDLQDRVFVTAANEMSQVERNLQECTRFIPFRPAMWQMVQPAGQPDPLPAAAVWKKRRAA